MPTYLTIPTKFMSILWFEELGMYVEVRSPQPHPDPARTLRVVQFPGRGVAAGVVPHS